MKEKGYSVREKRVTEQEFSRKMEIEAKMADDREREAENLAKAAEKPTVVRPMSVASKRMATQGSVVKRPTTPRVGRGF